MQRPSAPPAEVGTTVEIERLYPSLDEGNHFRLQKVCEIQQQLEKERDVRAALYKKYRRGINAVDGVDTALVGASLAMGAAGVALLTTVIAAPIVLGLEIAAVACGLAGMAGKFVGRRLLIKAKKHDELRVLAEAKLNTISSHISQALQDDQISDEEYKLVLDEMDKYDHLKAEIRAQAHKAHSASIDEATKNKLILQGREEAKASMLKTLGGDSQ